MRRAHLIDNFDHRHNIHYALGVDWEPRRHLSWFRWHSLALCIWYCSELAMADLCKLDVHRYFDLPDIYLCAADNQFRCRRRE